MSCTVLLSNCFFFETKLLGNMFKAFLDDLLSAFENSRIFSTEYYTKLAAGIFLFWLCFHTLFC